MNHRLVTLEALTTYSADTTRIIDINLVDPISALIFDLEVHNSAAGSMTNHPVACMTKVELVDGSNVLFSLSGPELEALDWYEHKTFRSNYNYALAGSYVCRFIGYQFGRYLWDPRFALDPKRFANPQLKVSLDYDAGGLSPTYNKLGIWAAVFDQKAVSPEGFLMTKEIKSKTETGAGHDYTDMPLDYPYRKLLIRSQKAGTEPNALLSNFKLSEDHDKRIPYNHGTEDILRAIMAQYPPVEETYFFALDTSQRYLMIAPTTRVTGWDTVWGETSVARAPALYDGDGGRLKVIAGVVGLNDMIGVQGWLPHGTWAIPFGDQDDPADWYNVSGIGSLRLDITVVGAETHQIIGQQLRA